ncbi:hypothetical protein F0562_031337 [Nyssa sinensis]|uniref:Uncharacterized protein n=1 Tax=Nyssa sinensis TaxID=561372 RepID=A0A5J5ATJ1_9ASTE|nr:hypothetical protein F0562_031337 [Nyssa sinensis]
MTLASPKESPTMVAYPKTLLSIAFFVGGLAIFLILASMLLVSQPVGSTVRGYFYSIDHSKKFDNMSRGNERVTDSHLGGNVGDLGKLDLPGRNGTAIDSQHDNTDIDISRESNLPMLGDKNKNMTGQPPPASTLPSGSTQEGKAIGSFISSNVSEGVENAKSPFLDSVTPVPSNMSQTNSIDSGCDLYHGKWVYDSTGPLYTNNSCPVLTQMQNCQGNGRPDKEYENWRWKPAQCDLPRFDAKKFLELMRGKTLAFIGDSVARNQMESMLCILWQVEAPKNRGNKRMQRYYFRSTSTMIIRIWSSWLVHQTSEPFDYAPEGVVKLHLDVPDEGFMEFIPNFDVIVLSSGHWFAKQSVYILNKKIVGGQLWWPGQVSP